MFRHHAAVLAAASSILISGCSDALLSGIAAKYRSAVRPVTAGGALNQGSPYNGQAPGDTVASETGSVVGAAAPVIVASGDAVGPSGSLAVDLELPRTDRGVQALPESTEKVAITVRAAKLPMPVNQVILRDHFVGGKARMIVEKLPLGDVQIEIAIYDDGGSLVTSGKAAATVKAGAITPILLNLIVKEETGGISIAVDSKIEYGDSPVVTLPGPEPAPPVLVDDSPRVTLDPIKSRNQSLAGYLSAGDGRNPTRRGTYKDDYALIGALPGDTITVAMAGKFDAYLQIIEAGTGYVLREDDDGGSGFYDAALTFTVRKGKSYIVRCTSSRERVTGTYTVTTTAP